MPRGPNDRQGAITGVQAATRHAGCLVRDAPIVQQLRRNGLTVRKTPTATCTDVFAGHTGRYVHM